MTEIIERVAGFSVRLDLSYDRDSHMWVESFQSGRLRMGLDPLEVETAGTVAALSFVDSGREIRRGEAFGSLESEKFVGPLLSPVSGLITDTNGDVVARPDAVDADPYGAWLVEVAPLDGALEAAALVSGPDAVRTWFTEQVREYRLKGVLAE
ncbi:MAG: glycine cleavage system protein H [Acidimicrobiales bacterium]